VARYYSVANNIPIVSFTSAEESFSSATFSVKVSRHQYFIKLSGHDRKMALAKSEMGLTIFILATQYTYIMQSDISPCTTYTTNLKIVFSVKVHAVAI